VSTVDAGSTIVVGVPGEGHLSEGAVGLVVETAIQVTESIDDVLSGRAAARLVFEF
jgi:hypothetical protein